MRFWNKFQTGRLPVDRSHRYQNRSSKIQTGSISGEGLHEFRPADFSGRTFGPKNFFLLQNRITLTLIFISHRAEIPCSQKHKPISMPSTSHENLIRGLLDSNNKSCTYKRDLIVFILSLYLAATRATFCERYSDCSLISNWKKSNKQRSLTHK
jgi:hypothetical protein